MLLICMKIDGGTTWDTPGTPLPGPKEKPPGTLSASTVWVKITKNNFSKS